MSTTNRTPLQSALFFGFLFAAVTVAAEFPAIYDSEPGNAVVTLADQALAGITLPTGLRATLFAAEPEVRNPIAMCWDPHGRLWIAENNTYAERTRRFDLTLRDRIVIFTDSDGDGKADSRRVFTDDLQMLTGIAVGHGGVWAMCPPNLLFIPDRNDDGVPDGPPEVVLDGFDVAKSNYHNFANGLSWGPDGWLYGRCGHSCPGKLGAPGTAPDRRVPLDGGIWRFHPQRHTVEVLTFGTTNPWGHDWDATGELFFVNTVNGHLWHMIPGARYVRAATGDPHMYACIDMHADHWHFDTGKGWTSSRNGSANDLGGGHAHCGTLIYQADNWPASYRNRLLTLNFHGRRINSERLERLGSGYVARHEPDAVLFGDSWFRGIDLATGPDGGVFVLDWSDTGECHDSTGVVRSTGRIFKIAADGKPAVSPPDLTAMSSLQLAELHANANDWYVRQARLQLHSRYLTGEDMTAVRAALDKFGALDEDGDAVRHCRALWTLRLIGGADDARLRQLLASQDEHVRVWAIRLLTDSWPIDLGTGKRPLGIQPNVPADLLATLITMAKSEPSALVRLCLAATMQRLPLAGDRVRIAAGLMAHPEDADDHNLPLMVWYGLIPEADVNLTALPALAAASAWPVTRTLIARRVSEEVEKNPAPLNDLLQRTTQAAEPLHRDMLAGMAAALAGRRKAAKPAAWDAFAAALPPTLADAARDLSVLFGDGRALDQVRDMALDKKADPTARMTALQALIDARPPDLRAICEGMLKEKGINTVAIRGLALFNDDSIGSKIIGAYSAFSPEDRPQLLAVLVTRPAWAGALLDAVAKGRIERSSLSAYHARQIRDLNDSALAKRLTEVWGEINDSDASKNKLITDLKNQLTPATLKQADLSNGRLVFTQVCAACHTLYGAGGTIGPDLTGSGRTSLDYLLENIVDPSAAVSADYRLATVTLKDGRILAGVVTADSNDRTLVLRTMTSTETVERAEVSKVQVNPQSMMPEGLLLAFSKEQTRDLIAYLMAPKQVPLPGK